MTRRESTRVFVISMRDSGDRRATFTERAKGASVDWTFFDARTEVVPGLTYDDAAAKVIWARSLSAGEIGCYASHYALWKQLLGDEADQYVVLEDDVIVDWKFMERLLEVDFHRSGIDYLRLHCLTPQGIRRVRDHYLGNRNLVELRGRAHGTQGYVVTREGAQRFVERFSRIVRPVDSQLDRYWEHGLPNLCLVPFPIIEEAGDSTIGTDRSKRHLGSISVRLERKARSALDRIRRRAWLLTRSREVREPCTFAEPAGE